ncbi:tRNA 2-selenouridine(34) synthase MnmH [Catalinimonas niigatensis]|uniref:tRNA 2-selenouridine(34) synthase MnmH n=1 Tax=Catalinimonas niigatensis TaxID=1397264 RepID=UPI002665BDE9|nr:tRNA 2-selenouridine(34) synthase MnmH [Catalinimonas niigatensis]WPP53278.1 tRNA 2-selenouridine(34) synthase MnmH [Catalinimonas niigatensis]
MNKLSAAAFLKEAEQLPIIDVRSPAEYVSGHIPGAHNIPLFDNRERAVVGTTYKQVGRQEALLEGLDLVGPKMRSFVEEAYQLAPDKKVLVHCWRGGMRSESFAWLLRTAGMDSITLEGGYKAYRNHILESLAQPMQLLIIGGETGSGKTDILKSLAELGEQVIDLEALAHHKGSSFGGIGQAVQPSTEQFHNNLHDDWRKLDLSRRIWLEDESFSIGSVQLPYELWNQMKAAIMIQVTLPKEERVKRLVKEYGQQERAALITAIQRIEKRLGGLRTQQTLEHLEKNQLHDVADELLSYYDRSYHRNMDRRPAEQISHLPCTKDDPMATALKIRKRADQLIPQTTNQ